MKWVFIVATIICGAMFSPGVKSAECADIYEYQLMAGVPIELTADPARIILFQTQRICITAKNGSDDLGWHESRVGRLPVKNCETPGLAICVDSFWVFALPDHRPKIGETWFVRKHEFRKLRTAAFEILGTDVMVDVIQSFPQNDDRPSMTFYVNPERGLIAYASIPDEDDNLSVVAILAGRTGLGSGAWTSDATEN